MITSNTVAVLIVLFAILIVGGIVAVVMTVTRQSGTHFDTAAYRSRWLKIEQVLSREQPASYQLAVLEADKLLDKALKEKGIKGQTMGERMKSYNSRWSNANNVWTAHKLRNQIAHETDVKLSYDDARRALVSFKQALKDTGAFS